MKLLDHPEFLAPALHAAVAKACECQVEGVVIGNPNDRSTWRIAFAEGATMKQLQTAASTIESFDVEASI